MWGDYCGEASWEVVGSCENMNTTIQRENVEIENTAKDDSSGRTHKLGGQKKHRGEGRTNSF